MLPLQLKLLLSLAARQVPRHLPAVVLRHVPAAVPRPSYSDLPNRLGPHPRTTQYGA